MFTTLGTITRQVRLPEPVKYATGTKRRWQTPRALARRIARHQRRGQFCWNRSRWEPDGPHRRWLAARAHKLVCAEFDYFTNPNA